MEHISLAGPKWKSYQPLIVITTLTLLCSAAMHYAGMAFMPVFMGLFLIQFALFKFFDLAAFVKGFQKYDLLTKRWPIYGYAYPFIELTLGLLYLSGIAPMLTNLLTLVIMTLSAFGVMKGIKSGATLNCACLGTILNVPLSTVSVVENIGMGLMALVMLARHGGV